MNDILKSVAEAKKKYARARTVKDFYLTKDSKDLKRITCRCCKQKLDVFAEDVSNGYRGNIMEFYPAKRSSTGKPEVVGMHYLCAWGHTMEQVHKLRVD